jgi:hypothetical protein
MNDAQIRERLAKIRALFAGATTAGERNAAEAALRRIEIKMQRARGPVPEQEYRFSLSNPWSLRLFIALCRSKGMKPYRYARMRRTTLCVKGEPGAINLELWPEFQQMDEVLTQYLGELADHIISDCINPDRSDAEMVVGIPGPIAEAERNA